MTRQLLLTPCAGPDWEVWALRGPGGKGTPHFEQTAADPAACAGSGGSSASAIVALPLGQCLTFPIWLTGTGPAMDDLFEPMILSQLEKRGLAPRGGAVFGYETVAKTESRTLVRVTLLPPDFPEALCFPKADGYLTSADVLPLPENRIVLWHERHNLVLAVTRGNEPVYTQVLSRNAQITPEVAREIHTIRLALEAEEAVGRIAGITLWGEFPGSGVSLKPLDLPVEEAERPVPDGGRAVAAAARLRLLPPSLKAGRLARSRQARFVRGGVIAVAGYIALALLLWVYLKSLQSRVAVLARGVTRDKPVATELERTAAAWRAIEPAVNPRLYAIEEFYQCVSALPPVGVRFTSFETKGTGIRLKGTARNATAVFNYANALRKADGLSDYRWKPGQPRLQKDDTAEFKIEGSLRYGTGQ